MKTHIMKQSPKFSSRLKIEAGLERHRQNRAASFLFIAKIDIYRGPSH
jgi:hypothetical protein